MREYELKKWPWNLLNDILKDEAKVEDIFNNPPIDLEATILYQVYTLPTAQQAHNTRIQRMPRILMDYYYKEISYRKIGEVFGVTQETIRATISQALAMLRQPSCVEIFRTGLRNAQDKRARRIIEENHNLMDTAIRDARNDAYDAGYRMGIKDALNDGPQHRECPNPEKSYTLLYAADIPVDTFAPNIRVYNALTRANILTIGDVALCFTATNGLKNIYGLGEPSINKLLTTLQEKYDIKLPAPKKEMEVLKVYRQRVPKKQPTMLNRTHDLLKPRKE